MLDWKLHENNLSKPPPAARVMTARRLISTPVKMLMKKKINITTSASHHTHTRSHKQLNPGAESTRYFYWLYVQWWCSCGMMHGVLCRDISLCTHTHNHESAKQGHHKRYNSFPRASTTEARPSGIYLLSHCSLFFCYGCSICVPSHYRSPLTRADLWVHVCLCACLFSHLSHVLYVTSTRMCMYNTSLIFWLSIDFSQFAY